MTQLPSLFVFVCLYVCVCLFSVCVCVYSVCVCLYCVCVCFVWNFSLFGGGGYSVGVDWGGTLFGEVPLLGLVVSARLLLFGGLGHWGFEFLVLEGKWEASPKPPIRLQNRAPNHQLV